MTISDIQTEARALVDADSTSYPDALLLIRENNALEEIASDILDADGRWQWDDTNRTDFPIGVSDLVSAQQDYAFDTTHLKIIDVSIKLVNGRWRQLLPFDSEDIKESYGHLIDRADFMKVNSAPLFYDKLGNSLFLYPAPDNGVTVTLTGGLKVYFQRTAQMFTSAEVSTGTKVPGFASPFHVLISYLAALPYAMSYKKERVPMLLNVIQTKKAELKKFYSKRDESERSIMQMKRIQFR